MKQLESLYGTLGYRFVDTQLVTTALTHRSAAGNHNERLEFLGDAVLNYAVSAELYRRFPEATEGELSRLRASLVNRDTLAELARAASLGDYIKLGPGELKSGGYRRDSILADSFEALIGAVYLDAGINQAQDFVVGSLRSRLAACSPSAVPKDPKTRLQELLQAQGRPLPAYTVVAIEGEAHNQRFTVACRVEGVSSEVVGSGSSRRRAEQSAAQDMLEKLGG
ncbi:MAG: ribonuclease III [Pseudomonadota bacterium]|nr:MAG: ribonuclease III [Pseudomonadota bacterium]